MPNPDAGIGERALEDKSISGRVLDDDLTLVGETTVTRLVVTDRAGVVNLVRINDGTGEVVILASEFGDTTLITINRGYVTPAFIGVGDSSNQQRLEMAAPYDVTLANRASFQLYGDDNGGFTGDIWLNPGATGEIVLAGNTVTAGEFSIPALTADPSSPADGMMWLHTVDNALYIWEGGAKRTVASW